MKTVVAIYTGHGLAGPLQGLFSEQLPKCRLVNIIDDSLIQDVIREGVVKPPVVRRLVQYYMVSMDMGADIILNTCSSVGEVVEIARHLIDTPILRIDEPMISKSVKMAQKIGVLATLPTTLDPTVRLIKSKADSFGKTVSIINGLADGAYQALIEGRPGEHDDLILKAATRVALDAEVLVLAQGSMARMEKQLAQQTGKIVLSSILSGIQAVKSMLEES